MFIVSKLQKKTILGQLNFIVRLLYNISWIIMPQIF